jgi:hypothetical protein
MKLSKFVLVCSFTLAAMFVQAAPGDVGAIPAAVATPESNIIFISGVSPENFLFRLVGIGLNPGYTTINGAGDTSINYRAFVGTASITNPIPGIAAGTQLIIIMRSQGGSAWGVNPVARAQNIRTLDIKSAACVQGANTTTYTCPVVGTDPVGNANGSNGRVPDFGVSEVEPAMFKLPYNTQNGAPQLTTAELANLVVLRTNQLMMGIVATNAVPAITHLSTSQYGAALAGKLDTWDEIEGTTAGNAMVVCRGVNGSGVQAAYNWMFTGFPCNSASGGFSISPPANVADSFGFDGAHAGTTADPFIIDPSAGLTIVENSVSGDVRNCLGSAYYGVDHIVQGDSGKFYKVLFSSVAGSPVPATVVAGTVSPATATPPALAPRGGPSKAIGVLSFDSFDNANSQFAYRPLQTNNTTPFQYTFTDTSGTPLSVSGWSFRQLDGAGVFNGTTQSITAGPGTGISPSKANLVNGKYDFVVELTMQRRPTLSALKTSFFNFLRNIMITPINNGAGITNSFPGFAALPNLFSYRTFPTSVNKYSRAGNTCAPLASFPQL